MSDAANSVIKSVHRVFEVLELFERGQRPLTSSMVSRQLDYPASSALVLLKSMVELGYLAFDPLEKTYFPTVRLTLLGQWIERQAHLGDSNLVTVVEALIKATGESVALSGENDLHMQFAYVATGPKHVTVNLEPGTLAPLFRSSIGMAALSRRSDTEIKLLAERHNRGIGRAERVSISTVLEAVEAVRRLGYAVGYDMYIEGVGALSWLLPNPAGGHGTVLSVSGPSERIRANEAEIARIAPSILRQYGLLAPERLRRRA